jgi:hypothetical protein
LKERIIEGWAGGAAVAEMAKPFLRGEAYDNFIHGEALPIAQIPKHYVLFRPLADVDPAMETPQTGVFQQPDRGVCHRTALCGMYAKQLPASGMCTFF